MSWYDWNQIDLPCIFSRERAQENRAFLQQTFAAVSPAIDSPRRGPLQKTWQTTGAGAFLEINSLAEDLRLLQHTAGVASVLRDLADARLCQPTWHMVHTAALFERARAGTVVNFIEAQNDDAPDFIVQLDGDQVPVEAKLLTLSTDEERFQSAARQIADAIQEPLALVPSNTIAIVALKRPVSDTIATLVSDFCTHHLPLYEGVTQVHRGPECNLLLEPMNASPGISDYSATLGIGACPRQRERACPSARQEG